MHFADFETHTHANIHIYFHRFGPVKFIPIRPEGEILLVIIFPQDFFLPVEFDNFNFDRVNHKMF